MPNYGLDAPVVVRNLFIGGGVGAVLAVILGTTIAGPLGVALVIWAAASSASMLVGATLMVWSSRWGKLRVRDWIIAALSLRGDGQRSGRRCGRAR